jgi:hypothetical protein
VCMEDINIGRRTYAAQWDLLAGTVVQQAVPGDDKRIAIVFTPPDSATVSFGLNRGMISGQGITLALNGFPFAMSIDQYGDLVRRPWFVIGSSGGLHCSVLTTSLLDQ